MRYANRFLFQGCLAILSLLIALLWFSGARAQDTLLITYQGQLKNDTGAVLDTVVPMVFTIYDEATNPLWNETHGAVQTNAGLFTVLLGSQVMLPDTVFNGEDRYLGIAVGGDPEMSPRILLTASPLASVARNVVGDLMTGPGSMYLRNPLGDSIFEFRANEEGGAVSIRNADGSEVMGVEPSPFRQGGALSMYLTQPLDKKMIEMTTDTGSAFINMYGPPSTPTGLLPTATAMLDQEAIAMSVTPSTGATIRMFQPQPEPPGHELIEMNTSPGGGASIYMFQPQPEPPGKAAIEMTASPSTGPTKAAEPAGGKIAVFSTDSMQASLTGGSLVLAKPDALLLPSAGMQVDSEIVEMSLAGAVPGTGGPRQHIVLQATPDETRVGIGTDTPTEELEVAGKAQVDAFAMPTGASEGHVLTSDAVGNATWQAASAPEVKCGLELDVTTASGRVSVTFPTPFSATPTLTATAQFIAGSLGQMGRVSIVTLDQNGFTLSIIDGNRLPLATASVQISWVAVLQ
jgi:hypothetical protein